VNPTVLIIVALLSAAGVLRDARRHAVPAPFLWTTAVFLFWIVALPAYVWRTRHAKESRKQGLLF